MRIPLALIAVLVICADAQAATSQLRVVDLTSGATVALADARSWSYPVWRPDGTLAATAGGNTVRALPGGSIAAVGGAVDTALSPAGDRLGAAVGERVEIRALSGDLLGRRRFSGGRVGLAWRRDGGQLAVAWTGRDRRHRITILGPDGTLARTYRVPQPASFSSAGWAPDGRSIAFLSRPDRSLWGKPVPKEIRRLDLATGAQTVLLRGTRCGDAAVAVCELLDTPVVAPDSARVAVVRDLNAVTLLAPPALPVQMKPSVQRDGVFDVAWAPDGASLLVAYVVGDTMRLARLSATPLGGVQRVVADLGHTSVNNLTVSPDGTRAAFSGTSDIDF